LVSLAVFYLRRFEDEITSMKKMLIAVATCLSVLLSPVAGSADEIDSNGKKVVALKPYFKDFGYPQPNKSLSTKVPSSLKNPYSALIVKYARQYGVPTNLAHAVVRVESNFNPKARGAAGEVGLMQIKPATARMMGFRGSAKALYHPETNIRWGMEYLAKAHKLGGGQVCQTILRYNAGHGAKRMNPTSKRYCGKVQTILASR
jgi:soluble lytic murein transglycosylase-like protein